MKKEDKKLKKLEEGVTENAPYKNLADYQMITQNDDDTVNTQGS